MAQRARAPQGRVREAPLRVAVILPDAAQPEAGALRLLETLCADPRFALVALVSAPPAPRREPAVLRSVLALETRLVARPRDVAAPLFQAARSGIAVWPLVDLGDLAGLALDVLVDLSHVSGAEALFRVARHGVWRLSSGAAQAGLVEAMTGAPSAPVTLWRCSGPGAGWEVLASTSYDVKFLAARNRAFQREKAPQLIEQALARLATGGEPAAPEARAPAEVPAVTAAHLPGYAARVARQVGRRLVNGVLGRVGGRPRRFCIRLCRGGPLDFHLEDGVEFDAPPGRYWADPFLFEEAGVTYLFLEEFVYRTGLGHIVVCRLDGDRLTQLGPALQTGTHLSYPFVFRQGGEIFMLPESGASGRLEVWRATDFPLGWELHATALEGLACADTTLLSDAAGMWIFTNICRDSYGDFGSELHLFRADGPDLREVVPHPLNPVVIGSRRARGAGRLFRQGGRLYRPSQDNSHGTYGYGLNIMEIVELGPTAYREARVRHVTPSEAPGLIGCHHVDALGGRVVCDVRRR